MLCRVLTLTLSSQAPELIKCGCKPGTDLQASQPWLTGSGTRYIAGCKTP